jgi:deoxyribodipyrimidine photo-lyase
MIPVFIRSPEDEAEWPPGAASNWWLHQSLAQLGSSLESVGSRLIIRRGPSLPSLKKLLLETGSTAVFWNRRYEPALVLRDQKIEQELQSQQVTVTSFDGNLLVDPWSIRNKSNKPFQVFTAFWRHCLALLDPEEPLPKPRKMATPAMLPETLGLDVLELKPKINWACGIASTWRPGETGAAEHLREFCAEKLPSYLVGRNRPDQAGTSRLSPYLHFGEISPRQVWHALKNAARRQDSVHGNWKHGQFLTEIGWREFAHHLLCHFPHTPDRPLRPEFERFPWRSNRARLKAWQRGLTGYPLVDAGMRELWTTGWMHNRVRMIVASFLVKDLLIPWQEGARWFWDTLVDADLANNTLGWQWTAGCGADAAPFFRIFNPVSQGEKFDPDGDYVRRWVPELAGLPNRWIHKPWLAPSALMSELKIELGATYPHPMVDHSEAREKALEGFQAIKRAGVSREA